MELRCLCLIFLNTGQHLYVNTGAVWLKWKNRKEYPDEECLPGDMVDDIFYISPLSVE